VFRVNLTSYLIESYYVFSVSSGEIEIIAYAVERGDCIVLIDDSKVYKIMDRFNLKYLTSANIIIDAYLAEKINKDESYRLLEIPEELAYMSIKKSSVQTKKRYLFTESQTVCGCSFGRR
jgi:predicted nucleic acid-binding protein